MTPTRRRLLPLLAISAVLMTACGSNVEPSADVTPMPTPEPTEEATPQVSAEASPEPTAEPTVAVTPDPSFDAGGDLSVLPNADADALFVVRDTCLNRRDGYQVDFPEEWYTNTEIGRFAPCVWFAPTFYEVPSPVSVPDEVAITIEWVGSGYSWLETPDQREDVTVGFQPAVRMEGSGPQGPGGQEPDDYRVYEYVIQLGPTPEEGPTLVVHTDTSMAGDYELNKALMDRMMTTIEFVGTTQ